MRKINPANVTRINIRVKQKEYWWSYQEEKRCFGIVTRRSGIYDITGYDYYRTKEEFESEHKNFYVENFIIYQRPNVVIYFSDGKNLTYWFETEKELNDFVEITFKDTKLIEV